MKKNKLACALFMLGTTLTACNKNPGDTTMDFYDNLYKTEYSEAFEEKVYETNKSLYGYIQNKTQGYNNWFYLISKDGIKNEQLTYDESNSRFGDSIGYIQNDVCYSKGNVSVCRQFKSNIAGDVVIYGNAKCSSEKSAGANVSIYVNGELLKSVYISSGDTIGKYIEVSATLAINDLVDFVVTGDGASISFAPVITKENSQNDTLYHLNSFGKQYGDVFPWYNEEEHKLYMWYLWSDNCLVQTDDNPFPYVIDLSSNLIKMQTYPEANNFKIYDKYKHNYRYNTMFDCNRFIDSSIYAEGVRDNMLYYDKPNDRYLLIGGCYRSFKTQWDSDLVIYASRDKYALDWIPQGNVVHANYTANLPECPSLMHIGKRWYPMVSVSHITKHQIGGLRYWMGEEDVDCMDVDWTNKKEYWLDGEDLCAARPTEVGDKFYMWGWITCSPDGKPFVPWAGYLNLPREVVQRKDGTLGGRMDPGLRKYINYGNLIELDSIEASSLGTKIGSSLKRTYSTFTVDMNNTDSFSLDYVQSGVTIKCCLEKENGKLFMRVRTPGDNNHPLNCELEVYQPSEDGKYDVRIVNDGNIFEFFVNEDNALTACTKLAKDCYDLAVEAGQTTSLTNVKINRLRSYSDAD